MTDDQIRQWATDIWGANLWTELQIQRLKRFAIRAVELEREGCAKACEADGLLWGRRYAAAIRARKPD